MVVDLLDPQTLFKLACLLGLMLIAAAYGYSKGHKEGHREGYRFGRSIRTNRTRCPECLTVKVGA